MKDHHTNFNRRVKLMLYRQPSQNHIIQKVYMYRKREPKSFKQFGLNE